MANAIINKLLEGKITAPSGYSISITSAEGISLAPEYTVVVMDGDTVVESWISCIERSIVDCVKMVGAPGYRATGGLGKYC